MLIRSWKLNHAITSGTGHEPPRNRNRVGNGRMMSCNAVFNVDIFSVYIAFK